MQLFKLTYKEVVVDTSNYDDCKLGLTSGRYLSEDGLKSLAENSEKNDCLSVDKFSFGMVLLSVAVLDSLDCCYDYPKFFFKRDILCNTTQRDSFPIFSSLLLFFFLCKTDFHFLRCCCYHFQHRNSAKWWIDTVKIFAQLWSRSSSKIKISIGQNSTQISTRILSFEACELQIITKVARWVLSLSCKTRSKDKQQKRLHCYNNSSNSSSNSSFCSHKQP